MRSSKKEIKWWGYLHQNGNCVLKRYFGESDLDEAYESSFCKVIVGPFTAVTHGEAIKKLAQHLAAAGAEVVR